MLNISIKAEPVFDIFGFPVTNSLFTSVVVLILLFFIAQFYYRQMKAKKKSSAFYLIDVLVRGMRDMFRGVVGDKIDVFFPIVGGFFFYILLQNWFSLLPGIGSILVKSPEGEGMVPLFRGAAADLNTTLALGLVSVVAMQVYGIQYLGLKAYLQKYFNLKGPIDFFLGLLEIISEVSRVLSFSFRLFGNIFAGEVLLLVIAFLVPVLAAFPFFLMEIFVGFVQALVFAMLTAVFLNIAVQKHH